MFAFMNKQMPNMPTEEAALPGRDTSIQVVEPHFINGRPLTSPYPDGLKKAMFGLGCFWGAERLFWQVPGVYVTAAGYTAGYTPNPSYEEVCSGMTGHNEVVLVVFDPELIGYTALLKTRSHARNAPRKRCWHPIPQRHLLLRRRAASGV